MVEFDRTRFDAALREFRRYSRRSLQEVLRQQAKGIVRQIADRTPPGGPSTFGSQAKKRGEAAVERDIRKILVAGSYNSRAAAKDGDLSAANWANYVVDPASVHKRYRNARGRVRREITPKIKVKAGDLKRLISAKKKMVGYLASGWKQAAAKFGAKLPAWITRHSGAGSSREVSSQVSIEVVATNSVGYADKAANINQIVQASLNAQAGNMRRQVESYLARAAKRAGFRAS